MIMKKIFFLLVIACLLISCEKNYEEPVLQAVNSNTNMPKTRAGAGTIFDFEPLSQLSNIPVNVINVANKSNSYLSAAASGGAISLYNKDDGSNRQRWYIETSSFLRKDVEWGVLCHLKLVGGNSGNGNKYIVPELNQREPRPILAIQDRPILDTGEFMALSEASPYYYIRNLAWGEIYFEDPTTYLQSESQNGTSLRYKLGYSNLAQWEVRPVGMYEVLDIEYVKLDGQLFERADQRFDDALIENGGETTLNYNFEASGTVNESSSHSETYGISVTTSSSVKVGIPIVDINGSVTGQSSRSWTFQESESKGRTVKHSITVPIPPGKTYKMDAYLVSHDVTVGFVATLKDTMNSNKKFKVKGLWTGQTASSFYCKVKDMATGNLIKTITEPLSK